ncbi:thiamine/thiamine pyrophosphate ABC transporter permease ThiP [Rhizobiaceae bacterium n13]|uniref:Thiamine transport system permease protein ThiP n=1 Tax=Ferirhizobium litorale TaxID=2927786 RepID=A0AAE3QCB7_9HYPH|nr:thiamine/thiamine pyrophosphate ABC transporter permease ThiP [Fererhizobium litorale]MDI7864873.1 thiamine/thiamine pyrophosphate ABC transporter permease ThiP [Fererhizobium litorale]MDI7923117.1 thiamine/thiamine pyrophosphate ABC transporter permease ThiP [Fererhizobium litorale]
MARRHERALNEVLTRAEHRRAIGGGAASLAGIALFIGLATAALLAFGSGGTMPSILGDPYIHRVLRFTLLQASLSTILSVALAIPVARSLARQRRFPGRIWIVRLMAVPMGLPVLIGALGLIGVWGRQGILNSFLQSAGLSEPVSIYGLSGILLAHVFFNLPLASRLILAGLDRIPGEYWLMASGLGMRPLSVFRFIEWPVIRRLLPGIAGLIFMLCATSFTLVLVLGGGPAATTIEVAIYQSLRFDFDPERAVALALLQITVTGLILAAMALFPAPDDHGLTSGKPIRRLDGHSPAARGADSLVLVAAVAFVATPLLFVAVAGMKADLLKLLGEPVFHQAALTSLVIALSAGTLAVLMAAAIVNARMALDASRRAGLGQRGFMAALSGASSLVLLVPPVVLGTGWFLLLRPVGDVTRFAPFLIIAINALMALPFVVRVLAPAMEVNRTRIGRLAASLGVTGFARLRLVDWPALRKPLQMAFSFAMALSLGDLGAMALFGSNDLMTLPWLLFSRLGSYRTSDADGLALILGLVCLALTVAGASGHHREDGDAHERR